MNTEPVDRIQKAIVKKTTPLDIVKAYAKMDEVRQRFIDMLGEREASAYIASVIIAVSNSDALQECSPKSVMSSAIRAAALRLSVDPLMRQAHLVPFGKTATLIVDYHGLVQLMERTGMYEFINVFNVFPGEIVETERFTGRVSIHGDATTRKGGDEIGWCAYYKTRAGSERMLYMTNEDCDAHGERYSKAYKNPKSGWNTDRPAMRRKTVLRILAQRWGQFSATEAAWLKDDVVNGETPELPDDNVLDNLPAETTVMVDVNKNLSELGYDTPRPATPAPAAVVSPSPSAVHPEPEQPSDVDGFYTQEQIELQLSLT